MSVSYGMLTLSIPVEVAALAYDWLVRAEVIDATSDEVSAIERLLRYLKDAR